MFKPGQSGNKAGRPKGSKNRSSERVKRFIEDLLLKNTTQIQKDFKSLTPKERVTAFNNLASYIIPKQQNSSIEMDLERLPDKELNELYNLVVEKVSKNYSIKEYAN